MKRHQGTSYEFFPIGVLKSPFKDRFGVPRQPGLAQGAKGVIKLNDDPDLVTALRRLEEFSHLWIVFVFHDHGGKSWKPSIRPPRLGGNIKVGVLSSRSPHRPNPVGISAVKLEKIDVTAAGGAEIHVSGIDLIDGTPVLDIKPYIPYADSIPEARPGWASEPIERVPVTFSQDALSALEKASSPQELQQIIIDILELDPRPAFQKRQKPVKTAESWGLQFGIEIQGLNVRYEIQEQGFLVLSIN